MAHRSFTNAAAQTAAVQSECRPSACASPAVSDLVRSASQALPGQTTPEGVPAFKLVLVGDGGTGVSIKSLTLRLLDGRISRSSGRGASRNLEAMQQPACLNVHPGVLTAVPPHRPPPPPPSVRLVCTAAMSVRPRRPGRARPLHHRGTDPMTDAQAKPRSSRGI